MARGFLYLVAILDGAGTGGAGVALVEHHERGFCLAALDEAFAQFGRPEIVHTDPGSPFTRTIFTGKLEAAGVRISMDGRGRRLDNVVIERLWCSLKDEEVHLKAYADGGEAGAGIGAWMTFHHMRRPHQALGYRTPVTVWRDGMARALGAQGHGGHAAWLGRCWRVAHMPPAATTAAAAWCNRVEKTGGAGPAPIKTAVHLVPLTGSSSHPSVLRLRVRRLFCDNPPCERRIFTERLPGIAAPWSRKTARLTAQLTALGLALGGAAGARLGLPTTRDTLLRLIRAAPLPPVVTPSVLGIDDWVRRKRHTYGTVLVDLERRRPVALLPDREAETLARWLREHPGVRVVARDRSGAYADGTRRGAPEAVRPRRCARGGQVADRFHLLQNLAEALETTFTAHSGALEHRPT